MQGRGQGDPLGAAASRRKLLAGAGALATLAASGLAKAETTVRLPLPDRPDLRPITTAFPQKGAMILQRSRAPLLETPFDVFDQGTFTPNDRFYVRWHWPMPSEVDAVQFRLTVGGHVERPLALSLADLIALPAVEMAAVNQCSGNSRGFFEPAIPGGQWGNGAMGNALWRGVRLKDVLDRAGVKAGAVAVRFGGLEEPVVPDAPARTVRLTENVQR
ncbi:MAG: molybdopterin-dependent oxidoreductase, partial [Alphaproteobacteria bacterium]|nr:molybdopterin-dependent oxidoreductase [Alphaproteobacteria bacterium]